MRGRKRPTQGHLDSGSEPRRAPGRSRTEGRAGGLTGAQGRTEGGCGAGALWPHCAHTGGHQSGSSQPLLTLTRATLVGQRADPSAQPDDSDGLVSVSGVGVAGMGGSVAGTSQGWSLIMRGGSRLVIWPLLGARCRSTASKLISCPTRPLMASTFTNCSSFFKCSWSLRVAGRVQSGTARGAACFSCWGRHAGGVETTFVAACGARAAEAGPSPASPGERSLGILGSSWPLVGPEQEEIGGEKAVYLRKERAFPAIVEFASSPERKR